MMDVTPSFTAGTRSNSVHQTGQYDDFSVIGLSPFIIATILPCTEPRPLSRTILNIHSKSPGTSALHKTFIWNALLNKKTPKTLTVIDIRARNDDNLTNKITYSTERFSPWTSVNCSANQEICLAFWKPKDYYCGLKQSTVCHCQISPIHKPSFPIPVPPFPFNFSKKIPWTFVLYRIRVA